MEATSTVDLQSVKALADENALLREEVRSLRDRLFKGQVAERESRFLPIPAADHSLRPQQHQPEQLQQFKLALQALKHDAPSASTPSWEGKTTSMQLDNCPTRSPSMHLSGLGVDNNGSLKGQVGLTALFSDRSCQLESWDSAGGLEWICKLQLADNYLTANLAIRRPLASLQLQVTFSVQFIYNGELLGTAYSQYIVLSAPTTNTTVCVETNKFDRSRLNQWMCSSSGANPFLGSFEVAIQIHSIVAAPSIPETITHWERQDYAVRIELASLKTRVEDLEKEIGVERTGTGNELEERIGYLEHEINNLKSSAVQPTHENDGHSECGSSVEGEEGVDSEYDFTEGQSDGEEDIPNATAPVNASTRAQAQRDLIDRLVGVPCETVPEHVMPERRCFFETIVPTSEQNGYPLLAAPQIDGRDIDLHRIYCGVRFKGGFEQVTKDMLWPMFSTEANPQLSESYAAGYKLQRLYQKHLLPLECSETGRSLDALNAFASKRASLKTLRKSLKAKLRAISGVTKLMRRIAQLGDEINNLKASDTQVAVDGGTGGRVGGEEEFPGPFGDAVSWPAESEGHVAEGESPAFGHDGNEYYADDEHAPNDYFQPEQATGVLGYLQSQGYGINGEAPSSHHPCPEPDEEIPVEAISRLCISLDRSNQSNDNTVEAADEVGVINGQVATDYANGEKEAHTLITPVPGDPDFIYQPNPMRKEGHRMADCTEPRKRSMDYSRPKRDGLGLLSLLQSKGKDNGANWEEQRSNQRAPCAVFKSGMPFVSVGSFHSSPGMQSSTHQPLPLASLFPATPTSTRALEPRTPMTAVVNEIEGIIG